MTSTTSVSPSQRPVSPPTLAEGRRQVWGRCDRNIARASHPRAHVVENRDHAWSLHDSTEPANKITKIRNGAAQTTLVEAAILGAIGAVIPAPVPPT